MLNAQIVQRLIERPWSPGPELLPARTNPEACGNSALPYRSSPDNHMRELLGSTRTSERTHTLSHWSTLYQYSVTLPTLHADLDGSSILHLSDVHFLKNDPRPILEIQTLTRWLKQQHFYPDVIAFTGDVITRLPDDLCPAAMRALSELSALGRHALFVYGNHDYHGRAPAHISRQMERCGFSQITGDYVSISAGAGHLNLYGIDDAYFGSPQAPAGMNARETNIALVHNLDAIRSNFPLETDLILSGHTHWGELKLPSCAGLPLLDGMWWMNKWGYSDNINGHTRHWDALSERTLSFVHPGLARYYVPRLLAHPPGFVLHQLRSPALFSNSAEEHECSEIMVEAA